MFRIVSLLTLIVLLVSGCSQGPVKPPPAPDPQSPARSQPAQGLLEGLYQQHRAWQGTPYRLGGNSRQGIDCSAFVMRTYATVLGYQLPRTTRDQQHLGTPIPRDQLTAGDLVFFRTSRKVRHVGIYVEKGRFLHASTSQGVMLSELDNSYWRKHYWQARRVIDR